MFYLPHGSMKKIYKQAIEMQYYTRNIYFFFFFAQIEVLKHLPLEVCFSYSTLNVSTYHVQSCHIVCYVVHFVWIIRQELPSISQFWAPTHLHLRAGNTAWFSVMCCLQRAYSNVCVFLLQCHLIAMEGMMACMTYYPRACGSLRVSDWEEAWHHYRWSLWKIIHLSLGKSLLYFSVFLFQ